MARIREKVLEPAVTSDVTQVTPVVAQVDGKNGFGFVAASMGMAKAVEMAQTYGIGMVSIKHSNHFGMSAWIVQQAIDAGMMSLVFTNSSPAMAVWGSKEKLVGVSPMACGAPGKPRPFILDMAPSVAARGKIYKALRRSEKIPTNWALDSEGHPTDDPEKALKGVMLPAGGPKGSALTIMMDVFSGVLSGSAFAGHVTSPYEPTKPGDVGHFLIAIKPDLFMSIDEFKDRMEYLYKRVTGAARAPGVDRIYMPGEIEQLNQEERQRTGIPYVEAEINTLNAEAKRVGADTIVVKEVVEEDFVWFSIGIRAIPRSLIKKAVLFKLKDGVSDDQIAELRQAGQDLVGKVPGKMFLQAAWNGLIIAADNAILGLRSWRMGAGLASTAHRARGFDMAIVAIMDDEQAVLSYGPNPLHQGVSACREALCTETVVYDMPFDSQTL